MKEENLIRPTYSAYLIDKNNPLSFFHSCFHSYEAIDWLINRQLCKNASDGLEIFQVLENLKMIHHGMRQFGMKPNVVLFVFLCFHSLSTLHVYAEVHERNCLFFSFSFNH